MRGESSPVSLQEKKAPILRGNLGLLAVSCRAKKDVRLDGGAERDRTAGLLVANEALSQLSYSPTKAGDTW